ncbi:MAG: DUF815 domain-containing protein [Clostridia bacterium]|nr:DUF815 domain-containing protein [Clostridia bacterium]
MTFTDREGREALAEAMALFARSTLIPHSPAMAALGDMLEQLYLGDIYAACRSYHSALSLMLRSPARRVSGSLLVDQLLYLALQYEHPFALCAAEDNNDDASRTAIEEELQVLGRLSQLKTSNFIAMVQDRRRTGRVRDDISARSAAVWSGAPVPTGKAQPEAEPIQLPLAFSPMEYGDLGLSDSFVSDEALEEIYLRMLETHEWETLTEDLWNFFSAYGTGEFLRSRAFRIKDGALFPLPEKVIAPIVPLSFYEEQRTRLMENTIRFMRGEGSSSLLLTGEGGVGKTAHVMSLLHELPEVRLVLCSGGDLAALNDILPTLAAQPLKFILLLDDIDPEGEELRLFCSRTAGFAALPENVLLYGTSRRTGGPFDGVLSFPYPDLNRFSAMIDELLENDGIVLDRRTVHNAAVDHQVDAREKLTFRGAKAVADRLKQRE